MAPPLSPPLSPHLSPPLPPAPDIVVIRPPGGWQGWGLGELWAFRELLLALTRRELTVHYKQTALGVLWAVAPPLALTAACGLLVLALGHTPPGPPYALTTLAAMAPWQFFANALARAGNSLVQHRVLVTKVYFPRLLLPAAMTLAALPELLLGILALMAAVAAYHVHGDYPFAPSWRLLALPLALLLALGAVTALGILAAGLNALYRDFQYLLRFGVQFLFFLTPILYPAGPLLAEQPAWVTLLYGLNPMAGVVEGVRWALFDTPGGGGLLLEAAVVTPLLLLAALAAFQRMEGRLADLV